MQKYEVKINIQSVHKLGSLGKYMRQRVSLAMQGSAFIV